MSTFVLTDPWLHCSKILYLYTYANYYALSLFTVCEKRPITGNVEYNPTSNVATLTFSGAHEDATTTCRLDRGSKISCKLLFIFTKGVNGIFKIISPLSKLY